MLERVYMPTLDCDVAEVEEICEEIGESSY